MDSLYTSLSHPEESNERKSREELIKEYFFGGYTNLEITGILTLKHGIQISIRQLRRILKSLGLKRRNGSSIDEAITAMEIELHGSGKHIGYRAMTQRLKSKYGLSIARDRVAAIQCVMDPEGVAIRRSHRLSRRVYINQGPNYLIHIDGYDKIKRFGFAIHGAICGFSRRVLWLKVARTNNDPKVVAGYFLQYILEIQGVPRCIRCDQGTENGLIINIQKAFRWYHRDDMAAERSAMIGSSPSNQRIERWWLSGKQGGCQFWIDFFKDLESSGAFSTANNLQKECLRLSFTKLIQEDLNQCRQDWNQHRIRPTNGAECPAGKPDLLYYTPELFDTVDYKTRVDLADIDDTVQFCDFPNPNGCSAEFENLCICIMEQNAKEMPADHTEALQLYQWLYMQFNNNTN